MPFLLKHLSFRPFSGDFWKVSMFTFGKLFNLLHFIVWCLQVAYANWMRFTFRSVSFDALFFFLLFLPRRASALKYRYFNVTQNCRSFQKKFLKNRLIHVTRYINIDWCQTRFLLGSISHILYIAIRMDDYYYRSKINWWNWIIILNGIASPVDGFVKGFYTGFENA